MICTKSQAAFILSVEKLFDEHPNIYFWTFTFRKVHHDWQYPMYWTGFMNDMRNFHFGWLHGLRVLEPHAEHGLHYHALIAHRISVAVVRRLGKRWGIGRVHVQKATPGSAYYLAKYLSKDNPLTIRMKRWGPMGGFQHIRKNNIQVDSIFHRNRFKLQQGRKTHFQQILTIYRRSMLEGPVSQWREDRKLGKIIPGRMNYMLNPGKKFRPRLKDKALPF